MDGAAGQQNGKAGKNGQHADLTQHTAVEAQEHVQQVDIAQLTAQRQRRGGSQRVNAHVGVDVGGHAGGKAQEQDDTPDQCGVGEVVAQAAEQLLGDHDGDKRADNGDPQRHTYGHVQRKDHARDHGGQILDRDGLVQEHLIQILKEYTGKGGNDHQHQRAHTENQSRRQHGGQQRNDHIAHQAAGGGFVPDMGRGGYN